MVMSKDMLRLRGIIRYPYFLCDSINNTRGWPLRHRLGAIFAWFDGEDGIGFNAVGKLKMSFGLQQD
jgi:hypothetical protein